MKKNSKIIIVSVCIALIGTTVSIKTFGTGIDSTPGSSYDPIVSKSYVDTEIGKILEFVINQKETTDVTINENINNNINSPSAYMPVQLFKGQLLLGGEGTEIILRSGTATGYTEVLNGLTNITTAKEILNGDNIGKDNLLIVPRGDGRGIFTTSNEAWVLIKGYFNILN